MRLSKIIVYVKDMASQVAFYRDVIGLTVMYPEGVDDYANAMWVTFSSGACTLALHGGGKGRIGDDAAKIVFSVVDIASERERLLSLDVPMEEVFSPEPGIKVSNARDPEGNPFSIETNIHDGNGG